MFCTACPAAGDRQRPSQSGRFDHPVRKHRSGFTLLELLVVTAIVVALIGLLMPAVQSARESARLSACSGNLKQLAQAMLHHETSLGYFPSGGWGPDWLPAGDRSADSSQPGGWTFAVLPFGRNMVPVDLDAGLLYFFAAGSATELTIFMAGWASRNKYSLLAAMRALAQVISYELPLLLSVVPVVLVASTLSTNEIVTAQGGWSFGILPHWNIFTPWGFIGFLLFLVAALAECNRSPFDLPEAESELIAGHLTEYSGFKYALFFMAEYFGLTALSGLGVTLFLGGWQAPCDFLQFIPSYLWFMGKLVMMIVFFIWVRGTLLRLRIDQLTRLAWQFIVPLTLINLGNAAFWSLTAGWAGPLQLVRLGVSLALVIGPFILLGRRLNIGRGPRTYRYATS